MRPEHPVAMITGASSGIGEETARALAAQGFRLALGARRTDRVAQLADELSHALGVRVFAGQLDVRVSESVEAFVAAAAETLGGLHVVVNNAGVARGAAKVDALMESEWHEMMATNVEGVLRVTRAAIPHLREAGWGHIVMMGSIAGVGVYEGGAAYCASKHAVHAISQTLRLELCGDPIRITEILPGMVETEFSLVRFGSADKAAAVYRGMTPLTGVDIAECVRWVIDLPDHVNIDEMVVKPRDQAYFTKVHREA